MPGSALADRQLLRRSHSQRGLSKAVMGLRKTSYDSLNRLEECTSFQNPFTGSRNADQGLWRGFLTAGSEKGTEERQSSQQGSVDPWKDTVPARARTGSLRGCQRGSSAAMAVLRSSPQGSAMLGESSMLLLVSPSTIRQHSGGMPEPDAQLHEVQTCIMSMLILALMDRTSSAPRG